MNRSDDMRYFFGLVVTLALCWALFGPFAFDALIQSLGLETIGIELRWTLFVAFTLACGSVLALAIFACYRLLKRLF